MPSKHDPALAAAIRTRFAEIFGKQSMCEPQRANFFITWCNELHQGRLVIVDDADPVSRVVDIEIRDTPESAALPTL